ncbi:MAG: amidohydrolase family protein [Actinomycetota bacterium]
MSWRDEDPGLPIKFGPCSNAEYDPEPLSPAVTETIRLAREACDRNARRLGMGRREFLLSAMGAATTLMILDACTRASSSGSPGGGYRIPVEATLEPEAARQAVGGDEFVFDVQGHLLEYALNKGTRDPHHFWSRFPQQHCGENDPRVCFDIEHFMAEIFKRSDTTMVSLSALPLEPDHSPLSMKVMEETRRVAERMCHDDRVLLHAQAIPNVGRLQANLDAMERESQHHPIKAWKVFTHYPDLWNGSGGWWLDDHERGVPKVGSKFIHKAIEIGVPIIAVHKGLSGGSRFASPHDVGPAARKHPHARFVVYHSGFETSTTEGPYTRATRTVGVNRLITSLREAGIGPNENVYAELGSTWWYLMRTPGQAAHVIGKLLKYVGEDNVLWGTDSIFYGSPQDQIQAFRALHIEPELQERYGYPKLTKRIKAKVLGLNAARLYGVDPITVPCHHSAAEIEELRMDLPVGNDSYGPATPAEARAHRAHHAGWPG